MFMSHYATEVCKCPDTALPMLTDEMKEVVEAFNKFEFGKN